MVDKPPPQCSNLRAVAAQPPPINWATKPKPRSDIHGLSPVNSQHSGTAGRQPVPICRRSNRLAAIEEALRQLTQTPSASGHLDRQANNSASQQGKPEDPGNPFLYGDGLADQSAEVGDLADSFSRLSTSEPLTPLDLFPARSAPSVSPSLLVSPTKKKYYVVTVGKCAGVYWDTWYACFFLFFTRTVGLNAILQGQCPTTY
jgi:hypothetical protein